MKRVFIVGCPRAGTTLLQTLLMSSGSLISFPESHFFSQLESAERSSYLPTGLNAKRIVDRWLPNQQRERLSIPPLTKSAGIKYFCTTLDNAAISAAATGWVEKTPEHVRYIKQIEQHITKPIFVHLLRALKPNVVSYHKARQKWGKKCTPLDSCREWFRYTSQSLVHFGKENHLHLWYEDLVSSDSSSIAQLEKFLGIKIPSPDTIDLRHYASKVVDPSETWKAKNLDSRTIKNNASSYETDFTLEERTQIEHYYRGVIQQLSIADPQS